MAISSFKRVEKKFLVDEEGKNKLLEILLEHMDYDKYCLNFASYNIQNIYYDTLDDALIKKSIQKPKYKEKIRVRKYTGQKTLFLEIKKKANGVVGKRRIELTKEELDDFINHNIAPQRDTYTSKQVIKELSYVLSLYKLMPKVYISYDRVALQGKDNPSFRVTFDSNIHCKRNNLEFDKDDYEVSLLEKGMYILEAKTQGAFPLWFARALSSLNIRPQSFSKYGTEFKKYYLTEEEKHVYINS